MEFDRQHSPEVVTQWTELSQQEIQNRYGLTGEIQALRKDNVTLIHVDYDHGYDVTNSVERKSIDSAIKKGLPDMIFVEYFFPELLSRMGEGRLTAPRISKHMLDAKSTYGDRFRSGKALANEIKNSGLAVTVADPANGSWYMINRDIYRATLYYTGIGIEIAGIIEKDIYFMGTAVLDALFACGLFLRNGLNIAQSKGIYSLDHIGKHDRLVIDYEQLRRFWVAAAIQQKADELSNASHHERSILLIYPQAHAIRIFDQLTNPKPIDQGLGMIYKAMGANLDTSIRTWEWKDTLARYTKNNELAGWRLTSKEKIHIDR